MFQTIEIAVETDFLLQHSQDFHYVFAYHICILNLGDSPVQLLSRKWLITDANGDKTEVQGDGVIGEQPVIAGKSEHRYSSFSVLKTPVGCMQGSYTMKDEAGNLFDAIIPTFTLAKSGMLN